MDSTLKNISLFMERVSPTEFEQIMNQSLATDLANIVNDGDVNGVEVYERLAEVVTHYWGEQKSVHNVVTGVMFTVGLGHLTR